MILDASMKLFVEEGFAHVSIRKIADLIEYSPTTVYLYFKDKDEIFYSLHDIGFAKLLEANSNLGSIRNPLLRLHKMGENYLNFGIANPEYYSLMFIDPEPMKKLKNCDWENGDLAINLLKAIVRECMERGYLAKGDPHLVSLSVWSTVHGLVSLAIRERMEKFIPQKEMLLRVMMESLNWLVNSIDISGKEPPPGTKK